MKRILIAGAHSYIGDSFRKYLEQWPNEYLVSELDTKGIKPSLVLFQGEDVVFCVTGVAHIKETSKNQQLYFDINRDLVVSLAEMAKRAGVHQFILLSSMAVYGMQTGSITKETKPNPTTAYGQSKYEADEIIKKLEDDNFVFACLRPPMVYGKNCTGNYQSLRRLAIKTPVFPNYKNQRSMIYIGNLCEFVRSIIDGRCSGLFLPQNAEYTNTSMMVKEIAEAHRKKIKLTKVFNWFIKIAPLKVVKKVFGDLVYEKTDIVDKYNFYESIRATEK